jgi:hypothetical protein
MKLLALLFFSVEAMLLPQVQKHHLLLDTSMQKQQNDKSVKKYLGSVESPSGAVLYHVMTHFYTVQASSELHGHSRILFFDKGWKQLAYYEVGMPDELPDKLKNNSLCFKYASANNKQREYQLLIGSVLPKQLCIEPDANCYTIHQQ